MPLQYRFFLILLFIYSTCHGQQIPQLSSFKENLFTWNSAYTARQDTSLYMILNHRKDWSQFDESPQNSSCAMILPFQSHPASVGFFVGQESFGVFDKTVGSLSYAYDIKFSKNIRLTIGNSFNFQNTQINLSNLKIPSGELTLSVDNLNTKSYVLNHGLKLLIGVDSTFSNFSLGASMHNSISDRIVNSRRDIQADDYLNLNGIYTHNISQESNISLGLFYLFALSSEDNEQDTRPRYYAIDLDYQYKVFHLGSRYNSNGFLSVYGTMTWQNFLLGLNWDYWTNSLNTNAGSGYEILLGYQIKLK